MSSYVSPLRFVVRTKHEKMQVTSIATDTNRVEDVKPMIDKLRELNAKDPGFCHTCRCTPYSTIWSFAYTIPEVFEEVDALIHTMAIEYRASQGLDRNGMFGAMPSETSACVCPFVKVN